jgi:hypothetical protein
MLRGALRHGPFALMSALALAMPARAADQSALAPSAMSQSTKPPSDDEIIVNGKTDAPPAVIRQQAEAITRATPVKRSYPLAMFKDKVCPGIVGMPAELAEVMVARIRANAERIGLQTASLGNCDPNILVLFVRNGQGVIKNMTKKESYLFKNISHAEMKDLAADPGPVHVWVNTEVRSRQGDRLQGDNSADLTQVPTLNVGQAQSHIFLANRLDITSAVIMIDIKAVDGLGVPQIADYVTMRTFARTNPMEGDPAATTILSLFDPGNAARPRALTDFDLAYLQAVYGGTDGLNAASKLASINSKLRAIQTDGKTGDD